MDNSLLSMAFEHLKLEFQKLKEENAKLKERVLNVEERSTSPSQNNNVAPAMDELLDTKQVLKILGICYNTLQAVIQKGLIHPIKINQRRIRFSRQGISGFIQAQTITPIQ
jgi:hypothetical protein